MGKYLKNGMSLVYLDQCVTSEFGSAGNGRWDEVYELLEEGVKRRRLMCPRSIEHMCETARMSAPRASEVDRRLRNLSFERAFLSEAELAAHQIVSKIRKTSTRIDDFLRKHSMAGIDSERVRTDLRVVKDRFDAAIRTIQSPVNEVRALTRNGKRGTDETKEELRSIIKDRYRRRLSASLDAWAHGITPEPEFTSVEEISFPHWATLLCVTAVKDRRFTPDEARHMLQLLERDGIDAIPALCIRAELEALSCFRRSKEEPGDQWDIMRIASALPYSDLMVVDGGRAEDVADLDLGRRFETLVFSTRRPDQDRLISVLQELVYGMRGM